MYWGCEPPEGYLPQPPDIELTTGPMPILEAVAPEPTADTGEPIAAPTQPTGLFFGPASGFTGFTGDTGEPFEDTGPLPPEDTLPEDTFLEDTFPGDTFFEDTFPTGDTAEEERLPTGDTLFIEDTFPTGETGLFEEAL